MFRRSFIKICGVVLLEIASTYCPSMPKPPAVEPVPLGDGVVDFPVSLKGWELRILRPMDAIIDGDWIVDYGRPGSIEAEIWFDYCGDTLVGKKYRFNVTCEGRPCSFVGLISGMSCSGLECMAHVIGDGGMVVS